MKHIEHLIEPEKQTLEELIKHYMCTRARSRAHAVLLSDRRF